MPITVATNLDYLIDRLRLHLGDIDPATYRYLDEWLRTAIVSAVQALEGRWNFRYIIDNTTYNVSRNTYITFPYPEPPIVLHSDERAIILQAAIIIKSGSLESSAWSVGSWRDAEISYSNISGGSLRDSSLSRDLTELNSILKTPQQRLAHTQKQSMPGYLNNEYERLDDK